ncbi:MAG TPA: iron-sulfur cluster assembly scaffold protein [Novosphingobium sp.]|nr:iron-sulfur cluster assembly scaffold protein [Novosphingobium sp.]
MSSAAALYTPEVLALATGLAGYPLSDGLALRGSARAPLCGSTIAIGLALDADERIAGLGIKAHACAIGQAAAGIFAAAARGQDRAGIAKALAEVELWLTDEGAGLPDWPGLSAIAAARAYPARHGAILLPWKAALSALP